MWRARSSSDQCEKGKPNSAGLVVASTMTLCWSSGGKSPRRTAAREVGQAGETVGGEAHSPLADRARIAAELRSDLSVAGAIGLATTENEPTAKSPRLRGGMGGDDALECLFFFAGETNERGAAGHAASSLCQRL